MAGRQTAPFSATDKDGIRYLFFLGKPVCAVCGAKGHLSGSCAAPYCRDCEVYGHAEGMCDDACSICGKDHSNPNTCKQKAACSMCGNWGHLMADCPWSQCERCQSYGHRTKDCAVRSYAAGLQHPPPIAPSHQQEQLKQQIGNSRTDIHANSNNDAKLLRSPQTAITNAKQQLLWLPSTNGCDSSSNRQGKVVSLIDTLRRKGFSEYAAVLLEPRNSSKLAQLIEVPLEDLDAVLAVQPRSDAVQALDQLYEAARQHPQQQQQQQQQQQEEEVACYSPKRTGSGAHKGAVGGSSFSSAMNSAYAAAEAAFAAAAAAIADASVPAAPSSGSRKEGLSDRVTAAAAAAAAAALAPSSKSGKEPGGRTGSTPQAYGDAAAAAATAALTAIAGQKHLTLGVGHHNRMSAADTIRDQYTASSSRPRSSISSNDSGLQPLLSVAAPTALQSARRGRRQQRSSCDSPSSSAWTADRAGGPVLPQTSPAAAAAAAALMATNTSLQPSSSSTVGGCGGRYTAAAAVEDVVAAALAGMSSQSGKRSSTAAGRRSSSSGGACRGAFTGSTAVSVSGVIEVAQAAAAAAIAGDWHLNGCLGSPQDAAAVAAAAAATAAVASMYMYGGTCMSPRDSAAAGAVADAVCGLLHRTNTESVQHSPPPREVVQGAEAASCQQRQQQQQQRQQQQQQRQQQQQQRQQQQQQQQQQHRWKDEQVTILDNMTTSGARNCSSIAHTSSSTDGGKIRASQLIQQLTLSGLYDYVNSLLQPDNEDKLACLAQLTGSELTCLLDDPEESDTLLDAVYEQRKQQQQQQWPEMKGVLGLPQQQQQLGCVPETATPDPVLLAQSSSADAELAEMLSLLATSRQ